MQRIQISRGDFEVRQVALPLLPGEFHVDNTIVDNQKLYIGLKTDGGQYPYSPTEIRDADNTIISGPDAAYAIIGSARDLKLAKEIASLAEAKKEFGAVYIISGDIQISPEEANDFYTLTSDGNEVASSAELKKGDIILYTGSKWLKVGGGANNAKEIKFYSAQSNATANVDNIQDALIALDSKKVQYMGPLEIAAGPNNEIVEYTLATGNIPGLMKGAEAVPAFGSRKNWADVEGGLFSVPLNCKIALGLSSVPETIEEGDFLVITASKAWSQRTTNNGNPNDRILTAADVEIKRIPGGTHDAAKIYIKGSELPRSKQGAVVYQEQDASISNVKEALQSAFRTKADLDPSTGKVLLSELPSTIIGAMDYQGTHAESTLPTAANKAANTDAGEHNGEAELVKGDYWIYTGADWDITSEAGISNKGSAEKDGKYYVSKGDWLVYNGTTFDILDNTDAFIGVKAEGSTSNLDGTVSFGGTKRTVDGIVDPVDEVAVTQDDSSNTIKYSAPNAILDANGIVANTLIKVDGKKNALGTGLSEADGKLTINEASGIKVTNGTNSTNIVNNTNVTENTVKLPGTDGTLVTDKDMGLTDGTDLFAAMFRELNGNKVLRDSFLKFLISGTDSSLGKANLTGIALVNETDPNAETKILLAQEGENDAIGSTQILPATSGYLLNSNSIIDCGMWTKAEPNGYMPREGHVVKDNREIVNIADYDPSGDNNRPQEVIEAYVVE